MADEHDATTCPLCRSPVWRHVLPDGDEELSPRHAHIDSEAGADPTPHPASETGREQAHLAGPGAGGDAAHERVAALEQAVQRLRSALIGVAERQEEHDTLPCYCVGDRGDGHQEWCVDARAALATTVGKRLARLRRADDLWAALGLPVFGGSEAPGKAPGVVGRAAQPSQTGSASRPKPYPDDPDAILDQVKERLPAGDQGASGDRIACERCGGAHPLEAKNTLLWYQCSDGSFYLGGVDGRLLLPRASEPEA